MCHAGTLLGAGGATAYYNGVDVTGTVRNLLLSPSSGSFPAWQQRAAGGGRNLELESLYKLVRVAFVLRALYACAMYAEEFLLLHLCARVQ